MIATEQLATVEPNVIPDIITFPDTNALNGRAAQQDPEDPRSLPVTCW